MKTIYLECNMGAAGDMLTAALLELHPDPEDFLARLNGLGLPGVDVTAEKSVKCGITGTHVNVSVFGETEESSDAGVHDHGHHHHGQKHHHSHHEQEHHHVHHEHGHHHHSGLSDIREIVSHLAVPEKVKEDVMSVYGLIAEAESAAHDRPVEEIHFHEVGTLDAVADVTAVCLLFHELAPEHVAASPVNVGRGHVHCAHGILPVPAPAAAYLLKGIPTYGSGISGELCTPTGAALLKYFVREFGPQPGMRVEKIGYGCGTKDFEEANCVRASLGDTQENRDVITELCCNLDDMTPEAVGFVMDRLFEAGALDVYTVAAGMKKNRPGIVLNCMCRREQREEMIRLIFQHTTTLGIRENTSSRHTLKRTCETVQTPYGDVRVKTASGWGVQRSKAEYDDLARIASENGISLQQAGDAVWKKMKI